MMPLIPLGYRTNKQKVSALIWIMRICFFFPMMKEKYKLVILRNSPCYRRNDIGVVEEFHDEITISIDGIRFMFECEGTSGCLCLDDLTERAFDTLLGVCEYSKKFDLYIERNGTREKRCPMSDII